MSEQLVATPQKEILQDPHLKKGHQQLDVKDSANQSLVTSDPVLIGMDLWKQLKRVTIPIFLGDKKLIKIGRMLL